MITSRKVSRAFRTGHGFTLIELLVVIGIIGILLALLPIPTRCVSGGLRFCVSSRVPVDSSLTLRAVINPCVFPRVNIPSVETRNFKKRERGTVGEIRGVNIRRRRGVNGAA